MILQLNIILLRLVTLSRIVPTQEPRPATSAEVWVTFSESVPPSNPDTSAGWSCTDTLCHEYEYLLDFYFNIENVICLLYLVLSWMYLFNCCSQKFSIYGNFQNLNIMADSDDDFRSSSHTRLKNPRSRTSFVPTGHCLVNTKWRETVLVDQLSRLMTVKYVDELDFIDFQVSANVFFIILVSSLKYITTTTLIFIPVL